VRLLFFAFVPAVWFAGFSAAATTGAADSSAGKPDSVVVLDKSTVYGLRPLTTPSAQDALLRVDRTPGGATVRSADQFQHGPARSLEDLLKNIPGVHCESQGTQTTKVSVRGSGIQTDDGPVGIQFLVDGIPVNDAEGEADIDDIGLRSVRYAEIYKGANSLDNGAYALGGAINLVPPTGYDADRLNLALDGGVFGEAAAGLCAGGVKGPLDWYASGQGRRADGYRTHSGQQGGNFFGDLGLLLRPGMENRLYLSGVDIDRALAGGLSRDEVTADPRQADPDSAVSQNFGRRQTQARIADRLTYYTTAGSVDAGAFWGLRREEDRSFFGTGSRDGIYDFTDNNLGASIKYATRQLLCNRRCDLTLGAAVTYEDEDGTNYANLGGDKGDQTGSGIRTALNAPLYGSAQISLLKSCSALIGCQAIFAQRRFVDRASATAGDDPDDAPGNTLNFLGINPKFGVLLGNDDKTHAFFNISHSWQPPSFDAMVEVDTEQGGGYEFTPLQPQQAWTVEAGLRGSDNEHNEAGWDCAVYRSWVHDELLDINDSHGSDIGTVNVGRTIHQGIEAGVTLEILNSLFVHARDRSASNRLEFRQSYTFNDFYFDNDPVYKFNRIAGIPLHVYEAQLRFESPRGFFAAAQAHCSITRFPADQANTLFGDPYSLWGCSIGYHAARGLSVYLEARNVFDKRYAAGVTPIPDSRTVADGPARVFLPGEGRAFFGGVGWTL
jgi:iron complex outermembrane recepter protein